MLERAERKGAADRIAELREKLAQPEFPVALRYLWRNFRRLRRRTAAGMSGPNPIEFTHIATFKSLTGTTLAPWEVELIEALDDAYLRAEAANQAEAATTPVDDPDQAREIPRRTFIRQQRGGPPR